MRPISILVLLGLAAGCASGGNHPDGPSAEPHFSAHEGRPGAGRHAEAGGTTGDDGDGILETILGVLFGGDDDS